MAKRPPIPPPSHTSLEATAFLKGLYREFKETKAKYSQQTGELHEMGARVELTEKTLCLVREHLRAAAERAQEAIPHDWTSDLNTVRFVGVRLADACALLLQEHPQGLDPESLMCGLNTGMFRFRTSSPLREIHGALLRQQYQGQVKRVGDRWVWTGGSERQTRLRLMNTESNVNGGGMKAE